MKESADTKSTCLLRRKTFYKLPSVVSKTSIYIILTTICLGINLPRSKYTSCAFSSLPATKVGSNSGISHDVYQNGECSIIQTSAIDWEKSHRSFPPIFMVSSTEDVQLQGKSASDEEQDSTKKLDIPMPTDAGGFTHTTASRAKISAANKGKIPWNKGKTRSEEVKKRIAEGVRRKNRENFLKKLEDLGLTEEEYEEEKKARRREKDAERRARRTEKGGYRPTEETKQKISKIMKEKFAKGEIKKRKYAGPFRKGFTHTEETKQKIRDALKKKWAEDPEYQAKMRSSTDNTNNSVARQKISNTLKQKWQDPVFREKMLKSMRGRKGTNAAASKAQRKKISEAMKKKWQDKEYRNKALQGMEKYRESLPPRAPKPRALKPPPRNKDEIVAVRPMKKSKKKKKRKVNTNKLKVPSATAGVGKKKKKKRAAKKKKASSKSKVSLAKTASKNSGPEPSEEDTKKQVKDDGDISRMREERRDLYDLLYGDDGDSENSDGDDQDDDTGEGREDSLPGVIDLDAEKEADEILEKDGPSGLSSFFTGTADLDDENLDDFDPYNLDDY